MMMLSNYNACHMIWSLFNKKSLDKKSSLIIYTHFKKEKVALIQLNDNFYLAELSDDAEKIFDKLYVELQMALLLLAGAGIQGL